MIDSPRGPQGPGSNKATNDTPEKASSHSRQVEQVNTGTNPADAAMQRHEATTAQNTKIHNLYPEIWTDVSKVCAEDIFCLGEKSIIGSDTEKAEALELLGKISESSSVDVELRFACISQLSLSVKYHRENKLPFDQIAKFTAEGLLSIGVDKGVGFDHRVQALTFLFVITQKESCKGLGPSYSSKAINEVLSCIKEAKDMKVASRGNSVSSKDLIKSWNNIIDRQSEPLRTNAFESLANSLSDLLKKDTEMGFEIVELICIMPGTFSGIYRKDLNEWFIVRLNKEQSQEDLIKLSLFILSAADRIKEDKEDSSFKKLCNAVNKKIINLPKIKMGVDSELFFIGVNLLQKAGIRLHEDILERLNEFLQSNIASIDSAKFLLNEYHARGMNKEYANTFKIFCKTLDETTEIGAFSSMASFLLNRFKNEDVRYQYEKDILVKIANRSHDIDNNNWLLSSLLEFLEQSPYRNQYVEDVLDRLISYLEKTEDDFMLLITVPVVLRNLNTTELEEKFKSRVDGVLVKDLAQNKNPAICIVGLLLQAGCRGGREASDVLVGQMDNIDKSNLNDPLNNLIPYFTKQDLESILKKEPVSENRKILLEQLQRKLLAHVFAIGNQFSSDSVILEGLQEKYPVSVLFNTLDKYLVAHDVHTSMPEEFKEMSDAMNLAQAFADLTQTPGSSGVKTENCFSRIKERINNGELVILPGGGKSLDSTGSNGHAVTLVFYKGLLIKCNAGDRMSVEEARKADAESDDRNVLAAEVFKIEHPSMLNDVLTQYLNVYDTQNAHTIVANLWTALGPDQGFVPTGEYYKKSQTVGNCTHESNKIATDIALSCLGLLKGDALADWHLFEREQVLSAYKNEFGEAGDQQVIKEAERRLANKKGTRAEKLDRKREQFLGLAKMLAHTQEDVPPGTIRKVSSNHPKKS